MIDGESFDLTLGASALYDRLIRLGGPPLQTHITLDSRMELVRCLACNSQFINPALQHTVPVYASYARSHECNSLRCAAVLVRGTQKQLSHLVLRFPASVLER